MTKTILNPEAPDRSSTPSWVRDVLEGHDFLGNERARKELEAKLPGIRVIFEHLVEQLHDLGMVRGEKPGEFPVAASVVRKNNDGKLEIVATATNQTNELKDSTAHAEMEAIKRAESYLGEKHLDGLYLLSTCEPCVMCSGAAVNTALEGVVYGVSHADVNGSHAVVEDEFKSWRTTPEGFDTATYLTDSGLEVVSGYMAEEVQSAMSRVHGSWANHYSDPDS